MSDLYPVAQALDAVSLALESGARPPTWAVSVVYQFAQEHFDERLAQCASEASSQ